MKKIQIDEDCQFLKDIESQQENYNRVNLGIYNLITAKGNLKLWTKGIKKRGFKLKDVKRYFGISGDAEKLLYKLDVIFKIVSGKI